MRPSMSLGIGTSEEREERRRHVERRHPERDGSGRRVATVEDERAGRALVVRRGRRRAGRRRVRAVRGADDDERALVTEPLEPLERRVHEAVVVPEDLRVVLRPGREVLEGRRHRGRQEAVADGVEAAEVHERQVRVLLGDELGGDLHAGHVGEKRPARGRERPVPRRIGGRGALRPTSCANSGSRLAWLLDAASRTSAASSGVVCPGASPKIAGASADAWDSLAGTYGATTIPSPSVTGQVPGHPTTTVRPPAPRTAAATSGASEKSPAAAGSRDRLHLRLRQGPSRGEPRPSDQGEGRVVRRDLGGRRPAQEARDRREPARLAEPRHEIPVEAVHGHEHDLVARCRRLRDRRRGPPDDDERERDDTDRERGREERALPVHACHGSPFVPCRVRSFSID